jgi:hypothetical protein
MGVFSEIWDSLTGKLSTVEPGKRVQTANLGLWESPVSRVICDSFLRAKREVTAKETEDTQQIVDFLNHVYSDHFSSYWQKIHPERAKEFAELGNVEHRYMPLIRMMASRISVHFHQMPETYLYRRAADGSEDRLDEGDPQVQQWREDERAAKLPVILPMLDLMLPGLRNVVVFLAWVRGRIRWRLYVPRLDVWADQDPDLPEELDHAQQVTIELRQRKDSDVLQINRRFMSWRYDENFAQPWTVFFHDEHGRQLMQNGEPFNPLFDSAVNEYGFHPMVLWRTDEPEGGHLWLPPREDWIQDQLGVCEILTDQSYGLRHQTHAQPVIEKMMLADSAAPVIGPKRALLFPDGGDFRYVGPPVDLSESRDTLNQMLRVRAVTEDMPSDTFEASGSTRNFNAKKLEAFALILRQARTAPAYRMLWEETTAKHMAIGNYWQSQGADRVRYDDGVRVGVKFPALPWPEDAFQKVQTEAIEEQRGTLDPVDSIMQRESVDRATAERLLAQRRAAAPDSMGSASQASRTPPDAEQS